MNGEAKKEENEDLDFDNPPFEPHSVHADRLLQHAYDMLEKGDRLQATEKAWGAYTHQMKALANAKGWKYDKSNDLFRLSEQVDDLAQKELGTQEGEVFLLTNGPGSLHYNFYKDEMPLSTMRRYTDLTKSMIDILRKLEGNGTASGNGNDAGSGGGPSRLPHQLD